MSKSLGHGEYGNCYLDDDGRVVKIFKKSWPLSFIDSRLVGLSNETYVFYDELIISNNEIIGAFSKYIDSKDLYNKNITLREIFSSIDKAYYDTDLLSNSGIVVKDIYPQNMLYDKALKIIDTDFYHFSKEKDNVNLENTNIRSLNQGYGSLFLYIEQFVTSNFIRSNRELFPLYRQTFTSNFDNRTIKEFLILLKQELEMASEKELTTTFEMKRALERIN